MKTLLISAFMLFSLIGCSQETTEYYNIAKKNVSKYNPPRKDYVIIIDYRKNILSERLYVVNMKTGEIVIVSKVSHALKSGIFYPTKFSNVPCSNISSHGNFVTKNTAYGKFGYSMIISGLDKDINTNAENRLIIFHSDTKMKSIWSLGCFATPEEINKKIVDLTKNGCLVSVIN